MLQFMGSQRVGHDRVTNTFTFREAVAQIDGNRGSGSDCWGLDTGPCTSRVTTGESFILLAKGDQFWVFIGRTDAEAETPILWPSHAKS